MILLPRSLVLLIIFGNFDTDFVKTNLSRNFDCIGDGYTIHNFCKISTLQDIRVHHMDPPTKQESMQCADKSSPPPKKSNIQFS